MAEDSSKTEEAAESSQPDDELITVEPQIIATARRDWSYKEQVTLLAPDGGANVIVSSEPLSEDVGLEQYAGIQGELLNSEFDEYVELTFEPIEAFGTEGYLRVFEWAPPDGIPVSQMQIYAVKDGRGFTATATTTVERYGDFDREFRAVLTNLRLRGCSAG